MLIEDAASEIAFGVLSLFDAAGLIVPEARREQLVNIMAGIARKEIAVLLVKRREMTMLLHSAATDAGVN